MSWRERGEDVRANQEVPRGREREKSGQVALFGVLREAKGINAQFWGTIVGFPFLNGIFFFAF